MAITVSLCANSFTKHRLSDNVQTQWTPCPPILVTETLPSEEGKTHFLTAHVPAAAAVAVAGAR